MLGEILWRLRRASLPQVTRRRIVCPLKRPQLPRDQICFLWFANPDGDINRASNQIHVLLREVQVNAHLWIETDEVEEDGGDEVDAKISRRRYTNQTAWLGLQMEHGVMRQLGLANDAFAVLEVQLSGIG